MRHHWPIVRTASAALSPLVLIAWIHWDAATAVNVSLISVGWLLAGALYTQFIEYWCHRVPMHRGLPYLRHVRLNHLEHHAIFHGASFQTRDTENLKHIAGRYWVFPVLFGAHYAVLALLLAPHALVAFMAGTVLHYLAFELSHWLTHIEDNAVDRVLARVPVVSVLRAYQIEHHRIHHEVPELAFNFNPPYLGDRLAEHMPSADNAPSPAPLTPVAPVLVMEPVDEAPFQLWRQRLVRYGSAAVVGVAVVGAVVVAHGLLAQGKRALPAPEQTA